MTSAKLVTPGLLKIKIFPNKGYDFVIPDYNVTNKILSRDSNYIVDMVMWPKFGNSSISMREVIITSILIGLTNFQVTQLENKLITMKLWWTDELTSIGTLTSKSRTKPPASVDVRF